MKRSFLHALAGCCALAFFAGIFLVLTGNQIAGMVVAFICMLVTATLLKAADNAPEVKSKTRRFAGWLVGLGVAFTLFAIIIAL
jgi:hypothetical protein